MASEISQLPEDFLQLARIALAGRPQDVQLIIHRASKKYQESFPQMADSLISLLRESPSRSSPLRKQVDMPLPVDIDSRLQLLKVENAILEHNPIFSDENQKAIEQVLSERKNSSKLFKLGLHPTKSLLFTGPPGVGKTLTAKWIAQQLERPLLTLDLAAVMSSYLGRTGNNIRYVLDYAKNMECVLLLDEIDAIAKRRDDDTEVGELKRLVTVLLQEIDDWPATGLLIAATNHSGLLDPALWRRFEVVLEFNKPEKAQTELLVKTLLNGYVEDIDLWAKILAYVFSGKSYSEAERQITILRKSAAISNQPLADGLQTLVSINSSLTREERVELACFLDENEIVSQRRAQEITGVSRDTIRKHRADLSMPSKIIEPTSQKSQKTFSKGTVSKLQKKLKNEKA